MTIKATTDFAVEVPSSTNMTGQCPKCGERIRYDALMCKPCYLAIRNRAVNCNDATPKEIAEWNLYRLLLGLKSDNRDAIVWP